jgi:hypothetical protein
MTCEAACPFTGCRAYSALMGDRCTGSFLSSDPLDPTLDSTSFDSPPKEGPQAGRPLVLKDKQD